MRSRKPIMPSPCERTPKGRRRVNSADLSLLSNISLLYVMRTWISQIWQFMITAVVKLSNKRNVGCIHTSAATSCDLLPLHPHACTATGARVSLFNITQRLRLFLIGTLIKTVNHAGYWDIVTSHLCIIQTLTVTRGCESRFLPTYWIAPWCSSCDVSETAFSPSWVTQSQSANGIEPLITILLLHPKT